MALPAFYLSRSYHPAPLRSAPSFGRPDGSDRRLPNPAKMAALPANWEFDYDGSRWFYRYKPTGLVQYHFPKDGDEYPEFVDSFAPPVDLAPEEKLESQQQLKRRSTTSGHPSSRAQGSKPKRDGSASATLAGADDGGGYWFPDSYMYLGPGGYNDLSPFRGR